MSLGLASGLPALSRPFHATSMGQDSPRAKEPVKAAPMPRPAPWAWLSILTEGVGAKMGSPGSKFPPLHGC